MTDSRPTQHTDDEVLIAHYREHSRTEPPAALDALILATAHREAPARKPNLWQRWMQACQQPRWQMAFATVAGVALLIGVVMRTPVPSPELSTATFSAGAPPPAHPAMAAAPMPRMAMAPQAEQADAPMPKMAKRAMVAQPSLEQGLQQILDLRKAGEAKAADEKLLELAKRFPDEDLAGRLEGLQRR
ncbi:MAG: hypothetical protein GAK37_00910 [Pseudomonas sp.]|nr:MAG: hypothetical protein GAK37_00910 [Pseudomonas sp.]